MEFAKHPRNQAYIAEMERWAAANASGDALYEATYGAEALAAAKHAEEEREQRREAARRQLDAIDSEEPY